VEGGDRVRRLLQHPRCVALTLVAECADGPADHRRVRDYVEAARARLQRCHADHRYLRRSNAPRHDRLQIHHDVGRDHDGVTAHLRRRRVPTLAVHRDIEVDHRAGGDARAGRGATYRQVWIVVKPEDHVHALHCAGLHHLPRTARAHLFRMLKHEAHRALHLALYRAQYPHRPEKAGRVRVVTARVHHAGVLRLEGHVRQLLQRQRVHVRAKRDHRALASTAPQIRDDTRLGGVRDDQLCGHCLQCCLHVGSGGAFFVAKAGVRVDVAAPFDDLRLHVPHHLVQLLLERWHCGHSNTIYIYIYSRSFGVEVEWLMERCVSGRLCCQGCASGGRMRGGGG
ncbi:hypothetical protein ABL78_5793, partial [Leptomonas seymouri]